MTTFGTRRLREIKQQHETWAHSLRRSGQAWNARFQSIDFVNLPRVMALPGGGVIWDAAMDIGIDPDRPLQANGLRSGELVSRLTGILETIDARAVPLNEASVWAAPVGAIVSFAADLRTSNAAALQDPSFACTSWQDVPWLEFELGRRRVLVRFDPRWLTTSTASGDLVRAQRESAHYGGLGMIVSADDEELWISALVFGKPMSDEVAAFHHAMSDYDGRTNVRHSSSHDFVFRPPRWLAHTDREGPDRGRPVKPSSVTTVALRFDEDEILPGQMEAAAIPALLRSTREYDRDLTIAVGSELPNLLSREGVVRGRADRFARRNVAALVVVGLPTSDVEVLHEAMSNHGPPYLEMIEIDPDLAGDHLLYSYAMPLRYKIVGRELVLLCAPGAEQDEDERLSWESSGLFSSVTWAEAPAGA